MLGGYEDIDVKWIREALKERRKEALAEIERAGWIVTQKRLELIRVSRALGQYAARRGDEEIYGSELEGLSRDVAKKGKHNPKESTNV